MPKPTESLSIDLRTNSPTKPPLLAPFFVKIPLPIAPDLIPITPSIENLKSYPPPLITFTSEFNEGEVPKAPVQKEQETVYRNNKNIEQYTVEDKEIYDEADVMKPASKQIHQLYVDEPTLSKQQDERYNELQRKEKEYLAKIKQQQTQRNRNQDNYEREEEIKENQRNREDEITNRNRDHGSQYSSGERRPAYEDEEDEESPERYEEHANQANRSNESSEQQAEKEETEKTEHYQDYDDNGESSKQSGEYKQDDQPTPVDFEKYAEVTYNQRLPIGDYFHENNPQQIRDSYGEVLDKKKLQDDRLSGYFSMFKQPYVDGYDYQQAEDPEDASQGDKRKEENGYDEHLKRIQKLRDEYALPIPESKYEEYDINDEKEANRNDRQKDQNHTVAKSKKPKAGSARGKENVRVKTTSESSRNQLQREPEEIKPQEELDLMKYTPLIVPIRYIDASDRVEEASMQQPKYEKSRKKSDNNQALAVNNVNLANKEKSVPRIASLPERPRQLAEGEHKEFQLWPPPFDYVFDNTVRTNTILPANPQNRPLNYYQNVIKNIADNDANNDNPSDQPAGYLVVVSDPVNPNQYPNDVYYFPKETINPREEPHLSIENMQRQFHIPQHNADQQSAQVNPNPIKYTSNETSTSPRVYYYEPQEAPTDVFNRYGYAFEEYIPKSEELPKVDARNQISNTESWSNKIYPLQPRDGEMVDQPRPTLTQLQNIVPSTQNVQSVTSEKRYPQSSRRQKSSRPEDQDDGKPKTSARHSVPRKPFYDPQSAHDFFNFSKNDYSFDGESVSASKVAEENGKNMKESRVSVVPEPIAYHRDESTVKYTIEPENDTEKAVVREYRNKVATLRVSEQRRSRPNGPIHYVDFTRDIQWQYR